MLKLGEIEKLSVNRFTDNGAYLVDEAENEVLLPNRYVLEEFVEGSEVEVFLYSDSEDRIVASTDMPFLVIGEVALLECVDISTFGAFVDWGLPKDLFVPISNQSVNMEVGRWYLIYAYKDNLTERIVGSAKLGKFISNEDITVNVGDEVEIVIGHESELGYRVIINNKHWGMIYHNQIFKDVKVGQISTGYIVRVTEDNRIDVSLTRTGVGQVEDASLEILDMLRKNNGELNIGDKSSPDEIYKITNMSKKMFKRGVGSLLKAGEIEISDFAVRLLVKK